MEIQGRGQLTDRIKAKSKKLLGYEITTEELRLMPYLQYVMVNNQTLDIRKISNSELESIQKWETQGLITTNFPVLSITKKFWDIINHLIFLGYIDLNREK